MSLMVVLYGGLDDEKGLSDSINIVCEFVDKFLIKF